MGTTKTVIDTNVIISAFKWGGTPQEIFRYIHRIEPIISYEQLLEVQRTAQYNKLNLTPTEITALMEFIKITFTLVSIPRKLNIIKEDPTDNIILETAIEHNADYLITGDKHLLKLKHYKNTKIVTPKEFITQFNKL